MFKKCSAAGIIIYRKRNLNYEILGLTALPHFQALSSGIYDVPKGMIDLDEDPEACARRECYEETMLKPEKLTAGPHKNGSLWLWMAECDKTPMLSTNPVTGKHEHTSYEWLDIDNIIKNCLDYLRPSLVWAKEVLQNENHIL